MTSDRMLVLTNGYQYPQLHKTIVNYPGSGIRLRGSISNPTLYKQRADETKVSHGVGQGRFVMNSCIVPLLLPMLPPPSPYIVRSRS